jgi:hypothetical protein
LTDNTDMATYRHGDIDMADKIAMADKIDKSALP